MIQYIDVAVAAVNVIRKRELAKEDRHVPGVYSVMVQVGLSEAEMASVALDVFHTCCGISALDDFVFFVFDPRTHKVLSEDGGHEGYSGTRLGRYLERIADRLPLFFSVRIEAIGDDQAVVDLGEVQVAAENKKTARKLALSLLWDDRLDAASCSPKYYIEEIVER